MKVRQVDLTIACATFGVFLVVHVEPVVAQETRAEVIREAEAQKQRQLTPPRENGIERLLDRLQDWGFVTGTPRGVYPWLGSVYPGGGWAGGAGVRQTFGDDGSFNVFGGYSISRFARVETDVVLPTFARNRARITLSGRYIDAPNVQYFGTGNSSSKEDRTRFGYKPATGGARLDVNVSEHLSVGGGVNYHHVETSNGRTAPSIEELFSPGNTPGLELSKFKYVNSTARAIYDWRRPLGYSGRGGTYRAQFDDYHESGNDLYRSIARRRSASAHSDPSCELGDCPARPGDHYRHRRHQQRALFRHALARRRHHPSRISGLSIPRSESSADERRAALDAGADSRHGALLRHREGDVTPRRSRFRRSQELLRHRHASGWLARLCVSDRGGAQP